MPNKQIKLYLAGPLGFSEAGREFYYKKIIPILKKLGYTILDPWRLTSQSKVDAVAKMSLSGKRKSAWAKLNLEIFKNNINALRECDVIFAVLDGTDVDSGTASELGFGYALGKPILGYRGDFRLSSENEGAIINLQVEGCIRGSGGTIITKIEDLSTLALKVFGNPK